MLATQLPSSAVAQINSVSRADFVCLFGIFEEISVRLVFEAAEEYVNGCPVLQHNDHIMTLNTASCANMQNVHCSLSSRMLVKTGPSVVP